MNIFSSVKSPCRSNAKREFDDKSSKFKTPSRDVQTKSDRSVRRTITLQYQPGNRFRNEWPHNTTVDRGLLRFPGEQYEQRFCRSIEKFKETKTVKTQRKNRRAVCWRTVITINDLLNAIRSRVRRPRYDCCCARRRRLLII